MRTLKGTAAIVLIVLAALLAVSSIAARFVRTQLLDTETYVATVAPLADDPTIQAAVTTRVTDEIMKRADIESQLQQLSGQVDFRGSKAIAAIAGPAINQFATEQVTKVVNRVVTSPSFQTVWTAANRAAHTSVNNILSGAQGTAVTTNGSDIVVDFGAVFNAVKEQLIAQGWTFLQRVPNISIPVTVAHIDNLSEIQRAVSILDTLATWLPFIAVALAAVAVWLAPNRHTALFTGLVVLSILLFVEIVLYSTGRGRYGSRLVQVGLNRDVGLILWDTMLQYLLDALKTILAMAVFAAFAMFLAGRSRTAVLFRQGAGRVVDPLARRIGPLPEVRPLVGQWGPVVGLVLGLLAALWLLLDPTGGTAIIIGILSLAAILAYALFRPLPGGQERAQSIPVAEHQPR